MNARRLGAFLAAMACLLPLSPGWAQEDMAALKAEAAGVTKDYGTTLLTALKAAIEASGPVGALSFCHDRAPAIAAEASEKSGWSVGRTSLKARNQHSAPTPYERKVMEDFAARIAAGEAAETLVRAELVEEDGGKTFHFIKAIPTGELCLTCHGGEIKPEIKAKLDELYPGDQATGFKAGDMRGVFTLSKRL